jgi:hypothetical protein
MECALKQKIPGKQGDFSIKNMVKKTFFPHATYAGVRLLSRSFPLIPIFAQWLH